MTPPFVKLGDVIDVLSGFAFKSEFFNDSDGLPVVRIRDVVRGYTDTYYTGPYTEQFVVLDGDILIGMDGNFNAAKWRGGRALLNQRVCKVTARASLLDEAYLFHYLPIVLRRIEDETPFVTVKHLSAGDLREERIPLPPLAEQRRIAAILDKADALRTKRREAMSQLDRLAQSILVEMFGDPIANPRKWSKASLAEVSMRVQIGPFGSQLHEEDYVEGGIPLVNPTHIRQGKIEPDWGLTIPESKYRELEQYHLAEGDLILGRRGEMGRCAVVSAKEHGWLCGTGSLFVRPDTRTILPAYLGAIVSSRSMRRHLENLAQGVTMANLNKDIVGALPIALPPLELQRAYLSRVTAVERLVGLNRKTQQIEQQLFSSLQHRAFRGEL